MNNDAVLWGIDKKTSPELYQLPLWQLSAETERLRTLVTQGSRHAKNRLDTVQRIFDERSALEAAVWTQRNNRNGGGDVHYHNTVTVPQSGGGGSTVSPVAAFGIGAALAAVVFFALSGLAVLVIVGLIAAVLIGAAILTAYLLHRRGRHETYTQPVAPQFTVADTLQPVATEPAETQDIRCIEHKPMRAIAMQEAVAVTPLMRKSTAVSTIRNTNKAVRK